MNKKRKQTNKIIAGLREAIGVAAQQPISEYERISDRLLKATSEINSALDEAHKCAEMRVFMGATAKSAELPMQFNPQIYKLTHSTMTFSIKIENPGAAPMAWRAIKDPSFQEAAGQGLNALRNKAA